MMNFPQYIGPWTNPKQAFGVMPEGQLYGDPLKPMAMIATLHPYLISACENNSSNPEACLVESKRRQDALRASGLATPGWWTRISLGLGDDGWFDLTNPQENNPYTDNGDGDGDGDGSILPEWLAGDGEEDAGMLIPLVAGGALGLLAFFGLILRRKG